MTTTIKRNHTPNFNAVKMGNELLSSIYENYPMLIPEKDIPVIIDIVTHKTRQLGKFNIDIKLHTVESFIDSVNPTALVLFNREIREFSREIASLSMCTDESDLYHECVKNLSEISLIIQLIKIHDLKYTYDRFMKETPSVYNKVKKEFFSEEAEKNYIDKFLNFFESRMINKVDDTMKYCVGYFVKAYQ